MVGYSSKMHGAGCGIELSPLPLAKSRDNRRKLRTLKPGESDRGRKGALKTYFHVGEELAWRFQLIKQDAKAIIVVMTFLTRANGVSFPAVSDT
jgi:hypothetical protein